MRRRVLAVALLPVPIMIGLCALFAWQIARLNEAARWVNHTNEALSQLHLSERLLIDQETAVRGYLLTNDRVFLQPLENGRQRFPQALVTLQKLTSDNPSQQQRIGEWTRRYNEFVHETDNEISAGLSHSSLETRMLSRKASMDAMRSIAAEMAAEERRLLQQRQTTAVAERGAVFIWVLGSLIVIGAFLSWLMFRSANDIEQSFRKSLEGERRARAAAEALAREVSEQSEQMQALYKEVRDERDRARTRIAELERTG